MVDECDISKVMPVLEKVRDYLIIANCHNVFTDSALEMLEKTIDELNKAIKNDTN